MLPYLSTATHTQTIENMCVCTPKHEKGLMQQMYSNLSSAGAVSEGRDSRMWVAFGGRGITMPSAKFLCGQKAVYM